jgi:hypothetical protein
MDKEMQKSKNNIRLFNAEVCGLYLISFFWNKNNYRSLFNYKKFNLIFTSRSKYLTYYVYVERGDQVPSDSRVLYYMNRSYVDNIDGSFC